MEAIMAVEHHLNLERPLVGFEGMRVSWGGVWAGVLVALGTLLVLSTLGVAVGFTADARNVDPRCSSRSFSAAWLQRE
jgi:hypothetical protein